MSILFVLIPLSLMMGGIALWFFALSAKRGDFITRDKHWSNILDIKVRKDGAKIDRG